MTKRRRPDPRLPSLEPRVWRRRDVLKLGAGAAAGTLALPLFSCGPTEDTPPPHVNSEVNPDDYDRGEEIALDPHGIPHDEALFPLAVGAGSCRKDGALLKAYTSDGAPKRVRVWRESKKPGHVVLVYDEVVEPNAGGFVSADIEGLAPATRYEFALFADGDERRSLVGSFLTAFPDDWLAPVRAAAMTCTAWDTQPWRFGERIEGEPLDMLLHLGDMAYNDGAVTLDDYREKWRACLSDPGYRAALPRAGLYMAWDDHEFTNNLNPEEMDPAWLQAGKEAFFEALPIVPSSIASGSDKRLWQSHRWGQSVEIITLDCRTERRPSAMRTDASAYLGEEQLEWLKTTLEESPCHFKVILNSVPMTFMPELWALAGDRWQGYAAAREELLSFIDDNDIDNVWFLSGDFHLGFVGRIEPDGRRRRMWEIAVGPSGNLGNPLGFLAEQPEYREDVFPSSQFLYGRGRLAATFLTFDPLENQVHIRFVDAANGDVLFDRKIRQGD